MAALIYACWFDLLGCPSPLPLFSPKLTLSTGKGPKPNCNPAWCRGLCGCGFDEDDRRFAVEHTPGRGTAGYEANRMAPGYDANRMEGPAGDGGKVAG